jgi:hypothetical protein
LATYSEKEVHHNREHLKHSNESPRIARKVYGSSEEEQG